MSKLNGVRGIILLMLITVLVLSACGTLSIDTEPVAPPVDEGGALVAETEPVVEPEGGEEAAPAATTAVVEPEEATIEPETDDGAEAEEVVDTTGGEDEPATDAPSEIAQLDETWLNYTNYRHGFSINFPVTMVRFLGSCHWDEADESYRPAYGYVPVKIFEAEDTVYIAGEYFHELSGETRETNADGGTRRRFSECVSVDNSLTLLQDPERLHENWAIEIKDVADDEALEAFIKARYGAGCSVQETVPSTQDGVYDVTIQGDGKDLAETACPLNFGTVVKYYPEGQKVIAWDTGQAPTFAADDSFAVVYDQEMIDSFQFLTGTEG